MSNEVFNHKKNQLLHLSDSLPYAFAKTHLAAEVKALSEGSTGIHMAGRVTSLRVMGKALFAHLYDSTGTVQIYLRRNPDAVQAFDQFTTEVSIGDFVGVSGKLFVTRTGEKTIEVDSYQLLNKSLRTLPEKFHGIEDQEKRYRQRYLDIIMNADARRTLQTRMRVIKTLRRVLEENRFIEVDTPILQAQASGALARPFFTHHNALDVNCSLRIAPETWLKRLVGAGFDRVFEFAKCFRNEGVSTTHLQEFTLLEFYASYWDMTEQKAFCQNMLRELVSELFAQPTVEIGNQTVDFSGQWPCYTLAELIEKDTGIDIMSESTKELLAAAITSRQLTIDDMSSQSWSSLVDNLYKIHSRPNIIGPCFVTHYPADMAPLARKNKEDSRFVDLFQVVVLGVELVKAYSELVDPVEQRENLIQQAHSRAEGDGESMLMDEDFLLAMEHGFPPMAGVGIGIDRLVMLLCNQDNIKEAVFFPFMRPQKGETE